MNCMDQKVRHYRQSQEGSVRHGFEINRYQERQQLAALAQFLDLQFFQRGPKHV
jgi:hypothetical protein